jgi:hypothetical protein
VERTTRVRGEERIAQRTTLDLGEIGGRLDRVHVLAGVLALGLTLYLAVSPTQNWLLLLLAGLAAIGTDAVVRHHPRASFQRLDDTALFLFVPVLFMLSLGVFMKDVADGYWNVGVGLASVAPFWLILRAEYESVVPDSRYFQTSRLVLNFATHVIAFFFFATIYDFDLSLFTASFAAGIVTVLLAIEILREEAMDSTRTILYSLAIGVLLAEAAWATHFLPLEDSAAAVFLLLTFHMMSGLTHNYLANRLNRQTASEFCAVALVGVAIIVVAQAT